MDVVGLFDIALAGILLALAGLLARLFRLSEPYEEWVARDRQRRRKR